ncbi:uncharacterized protein LOC110820232 [Carica papaya]|uniref:uncharacterized protein LOC110820232 n=1 Tax=Carica papaya TaxID=3649 RepID=UPI000B8D1B5E|nr:uncharacterized protein LOC110820232 [Carica papaya]
MGVMLMSGLTSGILPFRPVVSSVKRRGRVSDLHNGHSLLSSGGPSRVKRKFLHNENWKPKSRAIVFSTDDSTDAFADGYGDGYSSSRSGVLRKIEDELTEVKKALSEAQARQGSIEQERNQLLDELARAEVKQQEYVAAILHDKEIAIAELEAAKSLFHQKLQASVEEKFALESKLVLAKQDAVELAVQVEKLAEIAFQQTTSQILEDARMRVSAAETSAAEAAYQIEEQIRNATEGTILSIVEQSKNAIEKVLDVAEKAGDHATKAVAIFSDSLNPLDEIASLQQEKTKLQRVIGDLESELLLKRSEVDMLKLELEQAHAQVNAFELRANDTEKALREFQESSTKKILQQEEGIKSVVEKMKKDAATRKKAMYKAFKTEMESVRATIEAVKETARLKDNASIRRCDALQRSLRASEAASKTWRQRAEKAESLLTKDGLVDGEDRDAIYVVNGGRIDLLTDDDSLKWKLLSDGPRREIPQWMARKIRAICPKFPPRKVNALEVLTSKFQTLDSPSVDEVWSIAQEKPKEGDTFIEHVIEKETIEKKRKTLEQTLQRNTIQWQRTLEQTKLESGTGTGREIVFQGFNWESWRRQWYLDLASKTADLSHCGVTAVWLPPPTESVAPQGYMPSDLYNLNSAYGSEEELKYCIEEMHSQNLLALGDVVLNHRCAHKQSPNGIWNIFGGKLAWGPEAIVCDDPNFQGQGNPSNGDIFHAAPNIDHSQDFVRKDITEWLNWLRNYIGFDGWRLDFVRGFSGTYVKEYIEASNPAFAIGEYWDSLAYEHGDLCYNQGWVQSYDSGMFVDLELSWGRCPKGGKTLLARALVTGLWIELWIILMFWAALWTKAYGTVSI